MRESADRLARQTRRRLVVTFGGPARAQVITVLAGVLALSSADTATVGASATQLRAALHISNTDIGLLVAVTAVVASLASVPFGVLADRLKRTRVLGLAIVLWGIAMIWSAAAGSFGKLLLARLFLGIVTAVAGPVVASLVGDYFPSGERGRVYGWILTGELLGSGVGFAVTGDIAALSWRAAFVILAIPTFVLARYAFKLPEPVRGGGRPLLREDTAAATAADMTTAEELADKPVSQGGPPDDDDPAGHKETDAQRLARERGVDFDAAIVARHDLNRIGFLDAARYILHIRTNVILIVASSCGYFYLAGVQTFGVEFVKQQYRVNQAVANLLLLVLGGGAVIGVLVAGHLSDSLLRRRLLNGRILLTGVAALLTAAMFLPALTSRSVVTALPYLTLAALFLSAQNPPMDAARLDIMPAQLWGRAEGVRTAMRTGAQALAPVTFGVVADHVFGGGRAGLQSTFLVMLVPLTLNGLILLRALRTYPRDVATAAAASKRARSRLRSSPAGGTANPSSPPPGPSYPPPAGPLPDVDGSDDGSVSG
ncbi:MAG: MFS transporter [Actinomycetota bacterium]|nr:MFS transporter [Actinomycetota bacterium]